MDTYDIRRGVIGQLRSATSRPRRAGGGRSSWRRGVFLVLVLAIPLVTTSTAAGSSAFDAPSPGAATALRELARTWRVEHGVPGVVVGIRFGDGEPLIVADGLDAGGDTPLSVDATFEIASITKTFTAALVLDLIDEGVLRLDDPSAYVPSFPNADRITIRHLLTHTSGLYPQWVEMGDTPYGDAAVALVVEDLERRFTIEEALDAVKDRPLQFEPGGGVQYSNVNTILLGAVIEAVTGEVPRAYLP